MDTFLHDCNFAPDFMFGFEGIATTESFPGDSVDDFNGDEFASFSVPGEFDLSVDTFADSLEEFVAIYSL